ncbi:MAG: hypothetical protein K0S01_2636 [Herbinix sp.]|jgi:hypothetical protein|nr:hypothetical protein [Herbinix sp.]
MKSLPIGMFTFYILLTLFLSFFGPMKYYNYEKTWVFIYIVCFLICLFIGYAFANKHKIVIRKSTGFLMEKKSLEERQNKMLKFITLAIFIALLSIFLEFIEILIKAPSSLALNSMARNYLNVRETSQNYSFPILFRFATGFFRNISLILGFYYWKRLKKKDKIGMLLFIAFLIIVNMIAYGTQKFIGDIIIYITIILAIKMINMSRNNKRKIIIYASLLLIAAILMFAFVQAQRYDMLGITAQNFEARSNGLQYFDTNHIIFKIFGFKYGLGIAILLTGYLSSGYYGLSLCFNLPFEWTYGVGNSYFISKLISLILGLPSIYEKTYLNRMAEQYGRNGLQSWNTIFPWLASDFTFIGALIIFILVGYIWQVSWLEILRYRNPVSIVLFTTISLGLIFVPANNQLFNGIDTYVSTILILFFWILYHKKYNFISLDD